MSKLAKILVKKEFTIERNLLLSNSFRKIFCVRGIRWFDVKRNGDPYSNPVTYPFCLATLDTSFKYRVTQDRRFGELSLDRET